MLENTFQELSQEDREVLEVLKEVNLQYKECLSLCDITSAPSQESSNSLDKFCWDHPLGLTITR